MKCLKCGRKIENGGVFCQDCLGVMEKYPVKQNTPLQLPRRKEEDAAKKQQKKKAQRPPEEQLRRQKRTIYRLSMMLAVALIVAGLLAGWIAYDLIANSNKPKDDLGKNYTTVETEGQ